MTGDVDRGRVLNKGDCVVWKKDVVAMGEHAFRKITHGRGSLDMKIAKHLVATPSSKQFNFVGIYLGT
jgi:hypothetical protein